MLRRMTPSSAQLTGGDLSVDILHTEDSVQIGDGTHLLGPFTLIGSQYVLPTETLNTVKTKLTDSTGTDYAEIEDVGGEKALKVSVIASVGGGGGGTAATDSSAFTATATQGTPIMGALDDVSSDALAEGEMGIVRMTSARAMHVSVQNASLAVTGTFWQATQPVSIASMPATPVTDNGGSLTVDGTVAVTNSNLDAALSTLATESTLSAVKTSVQLIDDGIATVAAAITTKGMAAVGTDGTNARILKTDSSGELQVDVLTMPTVAVTGTFWQATQPVSGTFWQATQPVSIAAAVAVTDNSGSLTVDDGGSSLTVDGTVAATQSGTWNVGTLTSITNNVGVVGSVAHDSAAANNPVQIAGRAKSANPTSVADGDVSYLNLDLAGRVVTQPFGPRELQGVQSTTITASAAETTIVTAAGASTYADLALLAITNSSSTALIVTLKDSTGGTTRGIFAIAANGGIVIPYPTPLAQSSTNANWTLTCGTSVSSIYVHAEYVKRV